MTRPTLDGATSERAKIIAMAVRNAMEDFHADGNLDDDQMAELNPIIRNAIATALHALEHAAHPVARSYINFQAMLVPPYWEPPTLHDDYIERWGAPNNVSEKCRHCGRDIVKLLDRDGWWHIVPGQGPIRGCRAASYVPDKGWDDSVPRGRNAAPSRTSS